MPPNFLMSTGFGLFRNSNLLTAHEHVVISYIDTYMYIHLLRVSGSYRMTKHRRKPSHSPTKRKSFIAR